jgi:hypothetical protein
VDVGDGREDSQSGILFAVLDAVQRWIILERFVSVTDIQDIYERRRLGTHFALAL